MKSAGVWIGLLLAIGLAGVALAVALDLPEGLAPRTQEETGDASSFEAMIEGLERKEGFLTVHTDEQKARVLIELPAPDEDTGVSAEAIHVSYLRSGLGSNPVGLDRGRSSSPQVVQFRVVGGKVFLEARNTRFIAGSADETERQATRESFARSILWAGDVAARAGDGRLLIDLSDFLLKDTVGVAARLRQAEQGAFALDAARSTPLPAETLVFPDNAEFEAELTFSGSEPGSEVRATAPDPNALTFTVHHSFVRLPEPGFVQREADPRVGAVAIPFADYAAPLDAPIEKRIVLRHRLEKVTPGAAPSPVKEPIVFYLDPGAPEPVRSALIEGASWWAEAFEAAGFEDAYRVEVLPEGAHPLDARYNVINWVHRQTRGWSYGNPIYDPRTGEIIKAVITLGSLRVRQDRMIFEGLLDADATGQGGPNDPLTVSLARLRQLSAHEVGHGLGFVHNMGASADNRASVMDYPAPLVRVSDAGVMDLSNAYDSGIGPWDILSLRYAYEQFDPQTDEAGALEAIAREAAERHIFVSDPDARPLGGAHPKGSVWDNGADAVAELQEVMKVRAAALADFGLANLPDGAPVSGLREVIVPIYLYHRYQVAAASKVLGGLDYQYAVKGDGLAGTRPVSAADQRRALAVLLETVTPEALRIPKATLEVLQPKNQNWFDPGYSREEFRSAGAPKFDALQAAEVAAGMTFDALLHPARLTRVADYHDADRAKPSVEEVFRTITGQVLSAMPDDGVLAAIQARVAQRYVSGLITLAGQDVPRISLLAEEHLTRVRDLLGQSPMQGGAMMVRRIERFLTRPAEAVTPVSPAPRTPPGSPIGLAPLASCHDCWFCDVTL